MTSPEHDALVDLYLASSQVLDEIPRGGSRARLREAMEHVWRVITESLVDDACCSSLAGGVASFPSQRRALSEEPPAASTVVSQPARSSSSQPAAIQVGSGGASPGMDGKFTDLEGL